MTIRIRRHIHAQTHTYIYLYIKRVVSMKENKYEYGNSQVGNKTLYAHIYIYSAFNKFLDFFVQAFKIAVDS